MGKRGGVAILVDPSRPGKHDTHQQYNNLNGGKIDLKINIFINSGIEYNI